MNTSNTEIPPINQDTIECDLRAFTRWLNALAEQVNWLSNVYVKLKKQVEDNTEDIRLLKLRVSALEERMDAAETRLTNIEERLTAIEHGGLEELINMLNGRIDMLYGWLPVPYGMIEPLGWKFAMGNISVMSNQTSPTDTTGPGIYTSGNIENNDVTFN